MADIFFTYEEWQSKGYQVKKGEKSGSFNKGGKPVFSSRQVFKVFRQSSPSFTSRNSSGSPSPRKGSVGSRAYTDYDYEDPMQWDWGIVQ